MVLKGIKISDRMDHIVTVKLQDILEEIPNGDQLYWGVLYVYGMGESILELEKKVNHTEQLYILTWKGLNELASRFYQVFDILIMGCKNKEKLIRYGDDREMYQNSDISIEMVDSGFWEVFSKDEGLISRLASKFNDVESLESDFGQRLT